MSQAGGPGKAPAATDELHAKSSSRRIEVAIGNWKFAFAVDGAPATGALRDFADTVSGVTGVDHTSALAAVLAAVETAVSTGDVLEAAA